MVAQHYTSLPSATLLPMDTMFLFTVTLLEVYLQGTKGYTGPRDTILLVWVYMDSGI